MADTLPYLCYLTIPAVTVAMQPRTATWLRVSFVALLAVSAGAHLRGAVDRRTLEWNVEPVNIDDDPGRVWDWDDSQIIRGL